MDGKLTDYQRTILGRIRRGGLFIEEIRYPTFLVLERNGLVRLKPWHRNITVDKVYLTAAGRAALEGRNG